MLQDLLERCPQGEEAPAFPNRKERYQIPKGLVDELLDESNPEHDKDNYRIGKVHFVEPDPWFRSAAMGAKTDLMELIGAMGESIRSTYSGLGKRRGIPRRGLTGGFRGVPLIRY